jgi:hypothetical protein
MDSLYPAIDLTTNKQKTKQQINVKQADLKTLCSILYDYNTSLTSEFLFPYLGTITS